ncbi:Mbov_0401 family ICE element transposase-like protein [Mycoplasmopsis bovis]|uniref:Mbov_0401 family ICE element transposase-like protein n=1 Tax=Mycoplasmopsis bovis TaxID=28903 RepID=UPI003D2B8F9C
MQELFMLWDQQAEKYKNSAERKKEYHVERKITRAIIVKGEIYYYTLYMYRHKVTRKCFVYYHNEILRLNKRLKYYLDDIERCLNDQLYERNYKKLGKVKSNKIPYYIYAYLRNKIPIKQANMDELKCHKDKEYDAIQIDTDDSYFYARVNGYKAKFRCRMATIHTLEHNGDNKIKNKTTIMQISNLRIKQDIKKNEAEFHNAVKNALSKLYANKQIIVSGDGAKVITTLATSLKSTRVFDKYHFIRELFKIYGFNETLNKANKRVFDGIDHFKELNYLYNQGKFDEFTNYLKHTINLLSSEPKTVQKIYDIKKFIRFYTTNNKFINETIINKYYTSGNAETFVSHDLKRYIGKNFGLKSINTIIRTIISETNHNLIII